MKKLFFIAAAFSLVAAVGCNKGGGSPKDVAEKFYKAVNNKDFNEAKNYATKESASMLDMMSTFAKTLPAKSKDIEVLNEKIEGETATVDVKDKETGKVQTAKLKKEDGKWKVAFDKSSMGSDHSEPTTPTAPQMDSTSTQPSTSTENNMNQPVDSMMQK